MIWNLYFTFSSSSSSSSVYRIRYIVYVWPVVIMSPFITMQNSLFSAVSLFTDANSADVIYRSIMASAIVRTTAHEYEYANADVMEFDTRW